MQIHNSSPQIGGLELRKTQQIKQPYQYSIFHYDSNRTQTRRPTSRLQRRKNQGCDSQGDDSSRSKRRRSAHSAHCRPHRYARQKPNDRGGNPRHGGKRIDEEPLQAGGAHLHQISPLAQCGAQSRHRQRVQGNHQRQKQRHHSRKRQHERRHPCRHDDEVCQRNHQTVCRRLFVERGSARGCGRQCAPHPRQGLLPHQEPHLRAAPSQQGAGKRLRGWSWRKPPRQAYRNRKRDCLYLDGDCAKRDARWSGNTCV